MPLEGRNTLLLCLTKSTYNRAFHVINVKKWLTARIKVDISSFLREGSFIFQDEIILLLLLIDMYLNDGVL